MPPSYQADGLAPAAFGLTSGVSAISRLMASISDFGVRLDEVTMTLAPASTIDSTAPTSVRRSFSANE